MRVTNTMMVNNMMRNLSKNLNRMGKMQEQMASGKRFSRPSDDPIGVSRSLRLNTEVANMEQYKRNADDTQSWMDTTEMAINNIVSILKRANELTVQAANETNSVDERHAIADEIKELKNQLIQIGNTTYAGSYIFSGFKTDKALFNPDGKYDLGGGSAKLTLDEVIEVNIGLGDRMGMNSVGQRVFGLFTGASDLDTMTANTLKQQQSLKGKYVDLTANPISTAGSIIITDGTINATINLGSIPYTNMTNLENDINSAIALTGLSTHVSAAVVDNKLVFESDREIVIKSNTLDVGLMGISENQRSTSRVDSGDESQLIAIFDQLVSDLVSENTPGIRSALSRISNQSKNINAIRSEIGVKSNRVELTTNRILDDTLNLQGLLSKNEDADMAEVIMNIKMEENVYQASLSTGARIIQPSLIDFLR